MAKFRKNLSDSAIKTERAKEHFRDLQASIATFLETNPHQVIEKDNPQSGQREFYFREVKPIPPEIPLRTGEVLHNLRSALDYMVCALVGSNHGVESRHTGFPIFMDADEYKLQSVRKIQGMRQEAMDAIHATKPYKCNGTVRLWQLRRLNDRDKHRLIVTTAVAFTATQPHRFSGPVFDHLGGGGGVITEMDITPARRIFPLKNGAVFFSQPLHVNVNPKFTFEIAFDEPEIIQGEPILPTLHELANLVDGITKTLAGFIV